MREYSVCTSLHTHTLMQGVSFVEKLQDRVFIMKETWKEKLMASRLISKISVYCMATTKGSIGGL